MRLKLFVAIISLFALFLTLQLYFWASSLYITVKFKEVRPLPWHISVLYKGIKIGDVVSVKHSDDFENTLLKLRLYQHNLDLPANVFARLMIEKRRFHDYDYIELLKPEEPASEKLVSGMVVKGESMMDMKNYFANQSKESMEDIKNNLYNASESLNTTIEALGELFVILQDTVEENRKNLKTLTSGIANSADNINSITSKIERATSEDELTDMVDSLGTTLDNIEYSTSLFKDITKNINDTTEKLNSSLPRTISKTESIVTNLDEISSGISTSLKKPFGGLRLMFGRSINRCD